MVSSLKQRYNAYSAYLRERYGEKVYKIPVNLPGTCPHRDPVTGKGGCIFCDEEGAGFDALSSLMDIRAQVKTNKEYYKKRFGAKKFISYFQSYTNTFLPVEKFKDNLLKSCAEDVVGISVSTRPDCVPDEHLRALKEVREERGVDIDVELGLQTVNYRTLEIINRGHSLAQFIDAVGRVKESGFSVCAHIILNLPWDDIVDAVEGARFLSALKVDYVKLHSLYVVEGTELARMYASGEISICSLDEYIARAAAFLKNLSPEIVVQRLAAKCPRGKVLFCNWGLGYREVVRAVETYLEENDIFQGMDFNYLTPVRLS